LNYPPDWKITDNGEPDGDFGIAAIVEAYSPIDIITEADEVEGGHFQIDIYNNSYGDAKKIASNSINYSGGTICIYAYNQISGILAETKRNEEDWRTLFIQMDRYVIGIFTIANVQRPDMMKIIDQVLLSVSIFN
jgi:hypothetical protein